MRGADRLFQLIQGLRRQSQREGSLQPSRTLRPLGPVLLG